MEQQVSLKPCPTPGHCEGSEVGDSEGFCNMYATHGTWTLDENVSALTCFPRSLQQIIDPATELERMVTLV